MGVNFHLACCCFFKKTSSFFVLLAGISNYLTNMIVKVVRSGTKWGHYPIKWGQGLCSWVNINIP